MGYFRKKPVVVEAITFDEFVQDEKRQKHYSVILQSRIDRF